MDLSLTDRCFVVTGGTGGLGLATARALVDEGARVVVASRDPDNVRGAVELLGAAATGVTLDIRDRGAAPQLLTAAREHGDRFDGAFISHAGTRPGPPSALTDEELDDALALAVAAPIRLLRDFAAAADAGTSLVLLTAVTSLQAHASTASSSLTRPGVWGYAKALADEVGPRGVRVNAVLPGRFATDRVDALDALRAEREGSSVQEVRGGFLAQTPLRRLGTPEELARVATFLLSPASSYVTGVAVPVDGGFLRGR